jgi:fatty-acyl-CoA synthase
MTQITLANFMPASENYDAPMRGLWDVEALEQVPLEARVFSWNLNDWIARGCARDPEKTAITYVADGDPDGIAVRISYRELQRRATQIANLLHSYGVGPEDVVLYLLPTVPQLYTLMLGAHACAVPCGINWMLKPPQVIELIRATRAKAVVTLGPTPGYEIWENLQSIRSEIPAGVRRLTVPGPGGKTLADSDLDTQAQPLPSDRLLFDRQVTPDDLAALVHSGGTTGSPKLVRLTHRGFAYKCWANALVMGHTPDDVIFADYPMFHIAGVFARGLLAIAHGMSIVIPSPLGARDKRFIENYWRFVEKFRITVLSGVPTTLATLVKNPPGGEDLSSLRPYATTGSTAFPADIARKLEQLTGVRMLLSYGSTEFTQNITQAPRDGDPKYGSAGIRLPYTQVRVVKLDAQGAIVRDCAVDEIGAVIAKGPSITPGYLDPRYDAAVLRPDGWINNGDLGRLDADGFLWITGRAKDVIIRGGHNIDPAIIEETLLKHPDVLLAAAVGKPDAYAGELPVAYVQLVPGAKADSEMLGRFALDNIPERAAAPKEIIILPRMPLTDVGKPAKPQLRRDAAQRAFAAVLVEAAGAAASVAVEVVPDEASGTSVVIALSAPASASRADVEDRIRTAMAPYPTAYAVRWTA